MLRLTAVLLALLATPALAQPAARSSGIEALHTHPRLSAPVVDKLAINERVVLTRCTRQTLWCLVEQLDGGPSGWVMGSNLVGAAAKVEATPFEFSFDVFDPLGNGRWPHS